MGEPLCFLERASLGTFRGPFLYHVSWNLLPGEAWLVTGPASSGKSLLAGFLTGKVSILDGRGRAPDAAVLVDWSLQQSILALEWRRDLGDFSEGADPGTTLGSWLQTQGVSPYWAATFGLNNLLSTGLKFLSSGELRRAFLAAAFGRADSLLVLDSPMDGLDKEGQALLLRALKHWKTPQDTLVVLLAEGSFWDFPWTAVWNLPGGRRLAPPEPWNIGLSPYPVDKPVIELTRGRLAFGSHVLAECLTWKVHAGEAWRLSGPNGCGKSTLLSLISGESSMAFTNDLRLFGQRRGPGLTLDEVRSRVRWISPRLLEDFGTRFHGTVGEVILSGWNNTQGLRGGEPHELPRARALAAAFDLLNDWESSFGSLSRGRQTAALAARAGMRQPDILILDEPGQALDGNTLQILHDMARCFLFHGTAVLVVAHNESQVPDWITHLLEWTEDRSIVTRRLE